MRKSMIWMVLLSISLFLLAGCGNSQEGAVKNDTPPATSSAAKEPSASSAMDPAIAEIYEKAKLEGKVIWWSPDDEEVEPIKKAFEAKYPGIVMEHFELKPSDAIQRIITEAGAGQTNVDVFDLYVTDVPLLKDRDLIRPVDWVDIFGVDPKQVYYENSALSFWHLSFPMVYNTNLVKPEEAPKAWEDLLDPKWKGKIIIEARGNAFPILAYSWGKDKTIDYVNQLMKQEPIITKGGTPTSQAIANGQGAIAIGTYAYKAELLKTTGAPVDWVKTAPVPVITHTSGVLKNAQHPNAAILLAHFVASEGGLLGRAEAGGGGRLEGVGMDLHIEGQIMEKDKVQRIIQNDQNLELEAAVGDEVAKIISSMK